MAYRNNYITNQAVNYAQQSQQQSQQQQPQIYQRTYQQTTPPITFPIHVLDSLPGVSNNYEFKQYYSVPEGHSGTYLIQIPINDVSKAGQIFSFAHPNSCVPLVLLPNMGALEFFTFIPDGVAALVTSFGSIVGEYKAGFQWMPIGRKVKFIVNTNFVPFDYPIKLCPTLDNVMVKIDTLLVFKIEKAQDFVVNLGPYKLTIMLSAFLEESIRSLARTVSYDEIYNIRGANLDSMVRSLTDKVKAYGVMVSSITITNVLLPDELQNSLQRTTKFESMQRCKDKEHVFNTMKLMNQQYLKVVSVNRQNDQKIQMEEAARATMLIEKDNAELVTMIEKQIAELNSASEMEAYRIILKGQLEEAKTIGEKVKTLETIKANGRLKAEEIKAEQDAYVIKRQSEMHLAVAQNTAQALQTFASAEAKCAKALQEKRLFALRTKQLAILESLTRNKGLVISGSNDYSLFAQLGAEHIQALPAPEKAK